MRVLTLALALSLVTLAGCMDLLGKGDEGVTPAAADESAAPPPDEPVEETPTSSPPPSSPPASSPAKPPASGNATNASASVPPPPPPAPRVETLSWAGTITGVGFGTTNAPEGAGCCYGANAAEENVAASFDVATALKGIVVEVVWTDAQLDLDLELDAPDHAMPMPPTGPQMHTGHWWYAGEGTPGAPDLHATIAITDADALALTGAWQWIVMAKGPVKDVAFTTYVTLFYDAPPASDFTALPPA